MTATNAAGESGGTVEYGPAHKALYDELRSRIQKSITSADDGGRTLPTPFRAASYAPIPQLGRPS